MKRSPRHGWSLVELRDGRWHVVTTGDREQLKVAFATRASAIYATPVDPNVRFSLRLAGKAVALFDTIGQRRDECPALPRTADGRRIEWPSTVPGAESAHVTLWQPRAVAQ